MPKWDDYKLDEILSDDDTLLPNVAYMRIGAATSAFKSNSAIYVS